MDITNLVTEQLAGAMLPQISRSIGADESTTASAISAAVPLLLGALARNASTDDGAAALHGALAQDHDGGILDNLGSLLGGGAAAAAGSGILTHILGGRRTALEEGLARGSGLSPSSAGMLLNVLAPIVLGALGRTQRQQGLDPGGLAGYLGGQQQTAAQHAPGLVGALSSLLDSNQDGSAIDDIARLAGGFLRNR